MSKKIDPRKTKKGLLGRKISNVERKGVGGGEKKKIRFDKKEMTNVVAGGR